MTFKPDNMKILLESFLGNPNIGLFGFVNNSICILPRDSSPSFVEKCKRIFKVKVIKTSIAGTSLAGVFCVGLNNTILLPKIVFDNEVSILKKTGLKVMVVDTDLTALGNNIVMNEHAALINPDFPKTIDKIIEKNLKIKVFRQKILGFHNVGAFICLNDKGGLVHPDIEDKELKKLEKIFKIPLIHATVNLGSPFIKSGILTNNNGVIVGKQTRGMELTFIQEGLGVVRN